MHRDGEVDFVRDELEKLVIKQAYEATLDPAGLADFEKYWGTYIDTRISEDAKEFNTDDPVDSHILTALDILERIRHVNETEQSAQILVDLSLIHI